MRRYAVVVVVVRYPRNQPRRLADGELKLVIFGPHGRSFVFKGTELQPPERPGVHHNGQMDLLFLGRETEFDAHIVSQLFQTLNQPVMRALELSGAFLERAPEGLVYEFFLTGGKSGLSCFETKLVHFGVLEMFPNVALYSIGDRRQIEGNPRPLVRLALSCGPVDAKQLRFR